MEWSNPKANARHAAALGLVARGERQGAAKLTADQVREIRAWRGAAGAAEIAEAYGVHRSRVYALWDRGSWAWLV